MRKKLLALLFLSVSVGSFAKELFIKATNPQINILGRYELVETSSIKFDYPAVAIRFHFQGTGCQIMLEDTASHFNVHIDNKPEFVIRCTGKKKVYTLAQNLNKAWHTVKVVKRTEASVGASLFKGIKIVGGNQIKTYNAIADRRIEFIGNSITCGYGNEGDNPNCPFSPETENAEKSYAGYIAKEFNADAIYVSYSGKGVIRNYGDKKRYSKLPMSELYTSATATNPKFSWNFNSWVPQLVFINLGTNDYSTQPHPRKSQFKEKYIDLIYRVRSNYPKAKIICVVGPMTDEPSHTNVKEVVEEVKKELKDVAFIGLPREILQVPNDYGCGWHPSVSGHIKMMKMIKPLVQSMMNW